MKRYIYLIKKEEESVYKIGISKNPEKRIKELQTGSDQNLLLIDKFSTEHSFKIENALHNFYKINKKTGEWFDLGLDIEINFIEECKKIEKNIKFLIENDNKFVI